MGKMLAKFIADKATEFGPFDVVEWGGGNGRLALHILDEMRDRYPETYGRMRWISVEKSAYHRREQQTALANHSDLLTFADSMLPSERPVVVLANELLDAFPVYRVKRVRDGFAELRVFWDDERKQFAGRWDAPVDDRLRRMLDTVSPDPFRFGQQLELAPDAIDWLRTIAASITCGTVIVIDYGDVEDELWAPHRMEGTFLCYFKHRAHDDAFIRPGEQDMTAHVNFSSLIREAKRLGLRAHLRTQKRFLLDTGVLELLQDHDASDPFSPEARANRAIRQLLISDGMSELFKVLVLDR